MERNEILKYAMTHKTKEDKRQHQCQFCNRKFIRENSLINHVCEQKRRWMNKDEKYVKLGFYAYKRFYEITKAAGKKNQTYEDFMKSKYYTAFTKFGRHVLNLGVSHPEGFIEFVIKSGVKLDHWTHDYVYEMYVRELCKRETPEKALERSLMLMQQWSMETGEDWTDFFKKISTPQAVRWIRNGKLTPWALFCAGTANELWNRMSNEQLTMIEDYVQPGFWRQKMKNHQEEVDEIKQVFKEAGI